VIPAAASTPDNSAKHLSPARLLVQRPLPAPGELGQAPVSRHYSRPDVYSTSPANCVAQAPSSPPPDLSLVHPASDSAALDRTLSHPKRAGRVNRRVIPSATRDLLFSFFLRAPLCLRYLFSFPIFPFVFRPLNSTRRFAATERPHPHPAFCYSLLPSLDSYHAFALSRRLRPQPRSQTRCLHYHGPPTSSPSK
jgi:hypothetical protein